MLASILGRGGSTDNLVHRVRAALLMDIAVN